MVNKSLWRTESCSTSRRLLIIILTVLIINLIFPICSARYGYTITVVVDDDKGNSTRWSRSFSAMDALTLQSESKVSGEGNFSKYNRVSGFSGISFKEVTSGMQGKLAESNKLKVKSSAGEITINGELYNTSNPITDQEIKSIETVHIETNETAPAFVSSQGEILFRGKKINNRNYYINGNDRIETDYFGKFLNKKIAFGSIFKNSLSDVDITSTKIREFEGENRSLAFGLSSISDGISKFRMVSGSNESVVEETYAGSFTISRKILMDTSVILNRDEYDGLYCCLPAKEVIDPDRKSLVQEIFDITEYRSQKV